MARQKRRQGEDINISFLDIVCCGFGAIVLLLMITKTVQPVVMEKTVISLDALVADLQQTLFTIRGETTVFNRDLNAKHEQLSLESKRIALLKGRLAGLEQQYASIANESAEEDVTRGKMNLALQSLTTEMERLLGENFQRKNNVIGGIPVDSEYIVFIIDTSGSMFNYGWERMMEELISTLDIYPQVKGIQIMNDMGDYMFTNYRGKWIPDTPGRREVIINRIRRWNPFSNSSPVEGIQRAIRSFYDPKKKISLFVFGDEFTGRSIQQVVNTVDRLNQNRDTNEQMVRIHAVGFPVQFARPANLQTTGIRFAALMRELTYRNGGTFVGLNDYRP
jgi:hypothetical protein